MKYHVKCQMYKNPQHYSGMYMNRQYNVILPTSDFRLHTLFLEHLTSLSDFIHQTFDIKRLS